jgi:hypothetical protein
MFLKEKKGVISSFRHFFRFSVGLLTTLHTKIKKKKTLGFEKTCSLLPPPHLSKEGREGKKKV